MHPLTPLFRGGLVLVIVAGMIIANMRDWLIAIFLPWLAPGFEGEQIPGDPVDYVVSHNLILVATLVVLGVVIVLVGLFYLGWRFHSFRITDDDVEVRSGVLFRTHRRAPLDRVQGVNLTRPMIARLAGMAKLEVVGAGLDANVKLEYLSTTNAEEVRADILRLASGRQLAEPGEAVEGVKEAPPVQAVEERSIVEPGWSDTAPVFFSGFNLFLGPLLGQSSNTALTRVRLFPSLGLDRLGVPPPPEAPPGYAPRPSFVPPGFMGFSPFVFNLFDRSFFALVEDALRLEAAGVFSIVLETVPGHVAKRVTEAVSVPTIGIGAGVDCGGQVLVCYDLLGLTNGFTPRFLKRYDELGGSVKSAATAFVNDVKTRAFPGPEHTFE